MIVAIDPGPEESAWVLCDDEARRSEYVVDFKKASNEKVLGDLEAIEKSYLKPTLVIEMIASYGMPVGKEVFETCCWIGRFQQHWKQLSGLEAFRTTRSEVKMELCERTQGVNDAVIRRRLIDLFGPGKSKAIGKKKNPGPLYGVSGDVWAALAVAVSVRGSGQ